MKILQNGNVIIEDGKGLILKATDGDKYFLVTIDKNGNLKTQAYIL